MNNKIMRRAIIQIFLPVLSTLIFSPVAAQQLTVSRYGLPFVSSVSTYRKQVLEHAENKMESVGNISGVILNLRYAGTDNFMHRKLYTGKISGTYLRKPVVAALDSVSQELGRLGYQLVIFDAYRPYSVTELLWEKVHDERYAADPAKGSGHNRGVAVDLTLAEKSTHRIISMPTDFDNFSDTAYNNFSHLGTEIVAHRDLLRTTMEKYGFVALPTEWWHFSWPPPERFDVMDLSFSQLDSCRTK